MSSVRLFSTRPLGSSSTPRKHRPLGQGALLLLDALDGVSVGIGLFDLIGTLIQGNHAFVEAFTHGDDSFRFRLEIEHFVDGLVVPLQARDYRPSGGVEELAVREVGLGEARYRLQGSCIEDPSTSGICLLVTLERLLPEPVSGPSLTMRFGLSNQEIRVAQLLAEGRSNAEIAAELRISPHTARNHTRKVLQKLGLRSRAQVANKLLQETGKGQ